MPGHMRLLTVLNFLFLLVMWGPTPDSYSPAGQKGPHHIHVGRPDRAGQAGPPMKVAAHITCCMHTLYEIAHHHEQVSVVPATIHR